MNRNHRTRSGALFVTATMIALSFASLAPVAAASHTACAPLFVITPGPNADGWTNKNDITFSWHYGTSSCALNSLGLSHHEARTSWGFSGAGCLNSRACSLVATDIPDADSVWIEVRFARGSGFLNLGLTWTAWTRTIPFGLDTVAPTIEMMSPTPNSVAAGDLLVESCRGNGRVSVAGETVAEVPPTPEAPPAPSPPEDVTLPDPGPAPELPADADATGPDACKGHVATVSASTGKYTIVTPEQVPEDPAIPRETTVQASEAETVTYSPFVLVNGVVNFEARIADERSGLKLIEFVVDGVVVDSRVPTGNGVYSFSWDTTTYTLGQHDLEVRAKDRADNVAKAVFAAFVVSDQPGEPEVPEVPEA